MATTRELRRRIKSINSTRKTTKAMELVSASRMRRASELALTSRPYTAKLEQLVADILLRSPERPSHSLFQKRPIKNVLLIIIASDRGLAGVYNSAVLKQAVQVARQHMDQGHQVSVIALGQRAELIIRYLQITISQSYPHFASQDLARITQVIASYCCAEYTAQTFDKIELVSTHFVSLLTQQPVLTQLLPMPEPVQKPDAPLPNTAFLYEPSPEVVLAGILPRLVEAIIHQALVESLASEHAARRIAMKSATDNASDIIDDLTLAYNGLRQGAITQELAEITSGAATLSD